VCETPLCLITWSRLQRDKKTKKELQQKKVDLMTAKDWIKIVTQHFNRFIRNRDKDKGCISCGKPFTAKFDAGHFYSTKDTPSLRFDEENVHGQCVHCNRDLSANLLNYRDGLIARYGEEIIYSLYKKRQAFKRWTIEELKELNRIYINKNK
jgi:hypothetical protein